MRPDPRLPATATAARLCVAVAAYGLALALAGCSVSGGARGQSTRDISRDTGGELGGNVVVFAAASLTESFTSIGEEFEAANDGTRVMFNFASSSALAQQIVSGAPADVFAAASPATMAQVTQAGTAAGEPTVFVRNRLQIAVPAGNPGGVSGLPDFATPELTIALCAPQVPCGAAAVKAFAAAGTVPAPDTLEQDVKATLAKVQLGEVDAGLVYRTDVLAAGDSVEGIDFPEAAQAVNDYQIVTLHDAPNPATAAAFVEFVRSARGRQILGAAGFDTE